MKEPSESSSSDSYHVLAKSDMLYWKANGSTNLVKWMPMFLQAVKGKFPLYASCIERLDIPLEWTEEFIEPVDFGALSELAKDRVKIQQSRHYKIQDGWVPLEDGSKFAIDPDTDKKIYYQVMVKELIIDGNLVISSVKTFSASSSEELEKKVNNHIMNTDAKCMGSAYISNGMWIQPIMNIKSKDKNTKNSNDMDIKY